MPLSMFRLLARAFTGEVLQTEEVLVSGGNVRLRFRLKRERSSGELYIMLKLGRPGSSYYEHLSAEDLSALAGAVRTIEAAIAASPSPYVEGR